MRKMNLFTPALIGLSDGLVIPFAFLAGLSHIFPDSDRVTGMVGPITLFASLLMAIGGYLTIRDEVYQQTVTSTGHEGDVKAFYENIGLPEEFQHQAVDEIVKDRMIFEELAAEESLPVRNPFMSSIVIFFSYCIAGLLSLLPYFFIPESMAAFVIAACITTMLLFISGFLKHRITGRNPWRGAWIQTAIGVAAAAGAYGIGWVLSQ